jgi:hypothetical protein
MSDPFERIAEEWDRDDGLTEFFGETKQELAERLGRYEAPKKNGNGHYAPPIAPAAPVTKVTPVPSGTPDDEHSSPLAWLDMSKWDTEPVPERKWAIKDRVPLNQAGLFSGEGGAGKSIIELMKDVAHVSGRDWLGSLPEIGPAFYMGAEDDKDELHIRLAAIAAHHQTTFAQLIEGLHVLCLLGQDATLCAANPRTGKVETTALYKQIYEAAGDIKPKNISIDTLSRHSRATRLTVAKSMASPCTCRR